MITTRDVEVTIKVVLQIDTDEVQEDIHGGLIAGPEDEDIIEEAIFYAVQEMDYTMDITEPGILVLKTEIQSYNV